jgi:SPX domain protein involved in polyphosphate accumulation
VFDLSAYINRLDLIKDTANQVIKDFDMFGLEIKFSGNTYNAYEELFEQIEPHIKKLITTNQQKFMGILYRIDLSEEQIKKAVKENGSESFSEIITDLVIKRELQKVVIRKQYKA